MVLPIAAGVGYALLAGEAPTTAAFVGLALAATSIGITSRVLADLGVLDRRFSKIIIGAAVIDDILALILIGVVSGAASGDLGAGDARPRRRRHRPRRPRLRDRPPGARPAARGRSPGRSSPTRPLVPVFLIMLALAILSALIGLAAIIGAFVAGLIVAETEAQDEIEHEIRPLGPIFTPFFFAVTGAQLDLSALLDPALAIGAVVLAVLGIATKVLGGIIGAWSPGRWSAAHRGRRHGAARRGRDRRRRPRASAWASSRRALQRRPRRGRPHDDRRARSC